MKILIGQTTDLNRIANLLKDRITSFSKKALRSSLDKDNHCGVAFKRIKTV